MSADLRLLPQERARRLPGRAPLPSPVPTRRREILRRLFVPAAEDIVEGVDADDVDQKDVVDDDDDDVGDADADDDDEVGGKGSPRSA